MNKPWLSAPLLLSVLAASGCYADDPLPPAPTPPVKTTLKADLALDIRDKAALDLVLTEGDIEASVTVSKGYGLVPSVLTGKGRVETFAEAEMTLYTARFDAPADLEGPCGGQDVSLTLSLERRGKNARVGGSLTAYCGKGIWHGIPRRVFRLSGDMPSVP